MAHLLLAVHLLLSVLSLVHCYYTKTGAECHSIAFFPGHDLAGEGYDIVTRERKGAYLIDMTTFMTSNNTCHVYRNPYLGYQEQKIPLSALDLRAIPKCQFDFQETRQSSASNLVSSMTKQDISHWKVGLPLYKFGSLEFGGTRSKAYNYATSRLYEDKFTFSAHRRSCRFYRYRVSDKPPLSAEFKKDVSQLPSAYNSYTEYEYRNFIDTYGTHYIREASLGGQFTRITAVRSCLASMNGFSSSTAHNCLTVGIRVALGENAPSVTFGSCTNFLQNNNKATNDNTEMHTHHTEVTGGTGWSGEFSMLSSNPQGYNDWVETLKRNPDIEHYSLRLMSDLVPHSRKKFHVKAAIEKYLQENSVIKSNARPPDCPTKYMNGYLTIHRAWDLKGDLIPPTDGYAIIRYGTHHYRTQVIQSDNPVWNEYYDLGEENGIRKEEKVIPNNCPKSAYRGRLVVTIVRAWDLKGDVTGKTESYAKMWYGPHYRVTWVIKSNYPRWNARYDLGQVDTRSGLRVEVWDKDVTYDDKLGAHTHYLKQGNQMFQFYAKRGGAEVRYSLTCDKYLTGSRCNEYKPDPN